MSATALLVLRVRSALEVTERKGLDMMRGFVLLLVLFTSVSVQADEPIRRLSGYQFDNSEWVFQPVTNPDLGTVDAIIAAAKPGATIGDNLNTVMFLRSGNEFEAWSWRNTTRAKAVFSAKLHLNVSDEDDALWPMDEELPWLDPDPIRPPSPYMAGMLTDDPLFEPVMESQDPQSLLDFLASIGYPVVATRPETGPADSDQLCPELVPKLLAMAGATEWAEEQELTDEETAGSVVDTMASWLPNCWPFTNCTPKATGPSATSPWIAQSCHTVFINQDITLHTGGATVSCNYEVRKFFTRSRSTPRQRSDCSTYMCRQTQIGKAITSVSCSFPAGSGSPIPPCPGSPACSTGPQPACSAASPTVFEEWGSPCQ